MKTIRKDKWKNRFQKRTIPPYHHYKSIDGTWQGLWLFAEKIRSAKGSLCGRCGSKKTKISVETKPGKIKFILKCPNRQKDDNGFFCVVGDTIFGQGKALKK